MATREDAELMVGLLRWGTEMGLDEALRTLFSPDFDAETASMDNPAVERTLSFCETVGTFVKQQLLDADLVRDLIWIEGIWAKVGRHALAAREHENEPRLYENFESLVTRSMALAAG
jgi:hypothetical protein